MKKRYIQYIAGILFLAITVGCSDEFTSRTPLGSATEAHFWSNEADALSGTNAMYYYMKDEDMFTRGFMWYINASDDMVTGRSNAKASAGVNFALSGDESYFKWMYPQSYKIVRRANDVLLNVPNIEMGQTLKDRLLGEAYFMRAFHYFWLAHTYGDNGENGGVPIVTIENMSDISFERPASVIDNYELIISDLEEAVKLLPLFTTYSSEDLGRAHRDAAYAYMAKTYLYWAQYDDSKWADVVRCCDLVTNSGSNRALINTGNPSEDFATVFASGSDFSSEYIWSVVSGTDDGSKLPGIMLENKGWGDYNGWGYYMPTQELYEAFEVGDSRRSATILEFGQEFQWLGETRRYTTTNDANKTGMQFNKYMEPYGYEDPVGIYINPNGNDPTTVADVPILRYAEILLMKSEALIMQGQSGDAGINAVRNRAGLASITGATLNDLKQERRVEFAGEFANRHFDLVRWGDADATYNLPLHGRIHSDDQDPDSPYTVKVVCEARPQFDPSVHHVWIIPNNDVAVSGIEQNKGWN